LKAAFARADIDGSGDLTFDEWHLAFGGEGGVEADVLRALFDEFDADQNGCVSLAEFQAGLKTVRPLATGLDEMKDLVRGIGLEDLFASHLALMLQERRPAGEKELPIDLAAIATHLNPGDMQAAWQMGLSDEVAHAFRKQLRLLQRGGGTMDAAQMNAKFAGSTFEGAYENLEEYLAGIEKHIGLAAVNLVYSSTVLRRHRLQGALQGAQQRGLRDNARGGVELCGQPRSRQDLPWRAPRHKTRRLQSCARGAETWRP
jgi:exonuclease VII small subunit